MAGEAEASLKRELGALDVFCIAAGAMISSGLFILPAIVFGITGPSAVLCYFVAALLMAPSMLTKLELSTAMPRSGGTYFFIERSLGALPGTFSGLANWFAISLKGAFALVGIGIFAGLVIPNISDAQVKLVAACFCVFFTLVNLFSVRGTGRLQVFMVIGLILALVWYIVAGMNSVQMSRFEPFRTGGWRGLLAATGMVFISYGGLTKVADVAEEVKGGRRAIPLGMALAYVVVQILYVLSVFVTIGVLPAERLGGSLRPISEGATQFSGKAGLIVMAAAAMLAFLTTANAGILSASRSPMAMSRDELLPAWFNRINRRFGTPHVAIIITAGFMLAVIIFLDIESLVKTASTMMLLLFVLENSALIVMRESRLPTYRPAFKVPLYPWLNIAAILIYLMLIIEMGKVPLFITGLFAVAGLAIYLFYGRRRIQRTSALIRVVERLTSHEIAGGTLTTELRTLVHERDDVVEDRFDRIVQRCAITDLPKTMPMSDFFHLIARELTARMEADQDAVLAMLVAREAESTTVVAPGLAIPHLIVEGEKKFDILIARCRDGIRFHDDMPPVHIVFVLAGSRDERPFHLRALMSIAQIAQQPRFEEHCLRARDAEEIRNIILIAERQRSTA